MGWCTKASGWCDDSLSGFAVLLGYFSKKILAHVGLNRKCNKCDYRHSEGHPGCVKNFAESAKAMEPRSAAIIATKSSILKQCNMQWAIPICDNDSGIIAALKNSVDYEIVQHTDKNHTSVGLGKILYKTETTNKKNVNFKELNSTTDGYLKKCFNYATSQNQNDPVSLAKNLKGIPNHAFNNHSNCCASWCGFLKNPETYTHGTIGDGLRNFVLLETLTNIFNKSDNNAA